MKRDNFLIRVQNTETNETKYFTKDTYVLNYIGCSQAALPGIKAGTARKFSNWKYDVIDGSMILWKDINVI